VIRISELAKRRVGLPERIWLVGQSFHESRGVESVGWTRLGVLF
jgi:hypothetical protein